MKYIKPINEFWGDVLKRDLLGETREEDKFHSRDELIEYLQSEIKKQGENVVIRDLDVSLIEDLSRLFYNARANSISSGIKSLDLSGWKTSNVEDMSYMFSWCTELESLNLSGWDTSKVRSMTEMFRYCVNLKSLDLSGWDTSNVENMYAMLWNCPAPYKVINNKIVKK